MIDQLLVARCYPDAMTKTSSQPMRLPAEIYDSAAAAVHVTSRSIAQQVAHWARLGRELERSRQIDQRAITRTLTGKMQYDTLNPQEQVIVREVWNERASTALGALNYEAGFVQSGESYSELDEHGNVVVHPPHH